MTLLFIIAIVLVVTLVGSLPIWPHSKNWGYYPIGGVSAVILTPPIGRRQCGHTDSSDSILCRPPTRALIGAPSCL